MSTFTNTAREVEMPNGDVVVIHNAPTGGENTTSNIKKFKYDDNGHVTESTAADAEDLNLNSYVTPTTGNTDIGASDDVQTAIGKLDHQSHIDQSNILLVQRSLVGIIRNAGGKNLVKLDDLDYIKSINTQGTWQDNVYTRNSVTFTINDDGTITVDGTNDSATISAVLNCCIIPYSEFALTGDVISGTVVNGKTEFTIRQGAPLYTVLGRSYSGSSAIISQPTAGADEVLISVIVYAEQTVSNEVVKPMICTQDLWDQSHEFQPYALNNQDLTKTVEYLFYTSNTVIPELVNNGSKNLWDFANAIFAQVQGTPTYTKTDTSIAVSTSSATTQWARVCYKITLPAGNYVWRTKITNFSATSEIRIGVADSLNNQDMTWYRRTQITGNGVFTVEIPNASNGDVYIEFYINFSAATAPSNTATFSENMICTLADWKTSQNYMPFARPNYDLTRLEAEDRAALVEQVDEGAKNEFIFGDFTTGGQVGTTATTSDNAVTVTGASAWAKAWRTFRVTKNTTYVLSFRVTNVATVASPNYRVSLGNNHHSGGSYYGIIGCDTTGNYYITFTPPIDTDIYLVINPNYSPTAASDMPSITVDNIMVCTEATFRVSPTYAPHRKSLDQLEAEDRAALIEVVDSGAKNKLDLSKATITVGSGLTLTRDGDAYVVNGTLSEQSQIVFANFPPVAGDNLILSGCPSNGSTAGYGIWAYNGSTRVIIDDGSDIKTPYSGEITQIKFNFAAGNYSNIKFYPMICTEADWKISQKFAPFDTRQPRTKISYFNVTTANTYEKVSDLAIEIPAGKTINVTATAYRSSNTKITGIQLQITDTQDDENIIAKYESNELNRAYPVTALYMNNGNTPVKINMYVKSEAVGTHTTGIWYTII